MMRYMEWSWPELQACPAGYVSVIVELAEEERRESEARIAESRRGRF